MHKTIVQSMFGAALLGWAALFAPAIESTAYAEDAIEVPIVISPSTLNLKSYGTWVTVHAEIAYSSVVGATVTLDDIPVKATFADSRGDLVAKFSIGDVKNIVQVGTVRLKLLGVTKDGGSFFGTDLIKVVSVSGK